MITEGEENLHVITSIFITTYSTIFRNLKDVFLSHLFGQFHIVFKIWSLISQPKKKKKMESRRSYFSLFFNGGQYSQGWTPVNLFNNNLFFMRKFLITTWVFFLGEMSYY